MTPVLAFSDQMITGLVEFSGPAQLSGRLPRPGMRRRGERRARDVMLPRYPARRRHYAPGHVRDLVRWGHQRQHRGGGPAAMLSFIFAVTIPAPFPAVPARLAGWAFAAVAGIGAQPAAVAVAPGYGAAWRRGAGLPGAGRPGRGDIRARPAADTRPDPGGQDGGQRPAAALPGCASPAVRPDRTAGRARLGGGRTRLAAVPADRSGPSTGGRLGRAAIACQSQGAVRRSSGLGAPVPGSGTGLHRYPAAVRSRATTKRSRARTRSFCGFGRGLGDPSVIARNPAWQEAPTMEPALARPRHEAIDHDDLLVHE